MTGDAWVEVSVPVTADTVESVAEIVGRYTDGGVAIDHAVEGAATDAWATDLPADLAARPIVVRGFLPDTASAPVRRNELERALWHLRQLGPVGELAVREIKAADWATAWKDHFHVHRIGERIIIRPTWRQHIAQSGEVVIALDPGMAFGTGLHPTTQLCLLELERSIRSGNRVADVGTGSGILAIGAALMGACLVDAYDIDKVAVSTAAENVEQNGLSTIVRCHNGSPEDVPRGSYDVVVANIIARVIETHAVDLVGAAAPGGRVICSGILYERHEPIVRALTGQGLTHVTLDVSADWCVICGTMPP